MKPTMTYKLAWAAGLDAGNRSMRKAGRKKWSSRDRDVATSTFNRLYPNP